MYKILTITQVVLLSSGITCGAVLAQNSDGCAPNQGQGGGMRQPAPGAAGGGLLGHARGRRPGIPPAKDVKAISSLSPEQRGKIEGIYQNMAQQLKPLMKQHRELKQQLNAGGGAGAQAGGPAAGQAGGGSRAQLLAVAKQIHETREAAWNQVKPLLSDAQLQELQQIREQGKHGQVMGAQPGAQQAASVQHPAAPPPAGQSNKPDMDDEDEADQ